MMAWRQKARRRRITLTLAGALWGGLSGIGVAGAQGEGEAVVEALIQPSPAATVSVETLRQIEKELDRLEGDVGALRGARRGKALRRVARIRRWIESAGGQIVKKPAPLPAPMGEDDFESLYVALDQAPDDHGRLKVLAEACARSAFTTTQVAEVLRRFAFSQEQLEAASLMIPRVVDLERGFTLFELFPRAADRRGLRRILEEARGLR